MNNVPSSIVPLAVPPRATAMEPPELTVVASANPPESTTIVPPLSTVSLVSCWVAVTL